MRRMKTRQAVVIYIRLALLFLTAACSSPSEIPPTPTLDPATQTPSPAPTLPVLPSSTPTPPGCLSQPGEVREGVVETTKPPQQFLIYLPPCYESFTEQTYPVIYLLHGQTYTMDQWARMGVPQIADRLIHSNEAAPFIVVLPDDRYWNSDSGVGFGDRLLNSLIPYVDKTYRTIPDRQHRAIGGLSRGGGWVAHLAFNHPGLFASIGLHSPAIFVDDQLMIEPWLKNIPEEERPRLWLDVGDADKELPNILKLEQVFTRSAYIHEFHQFTGDHSETYWSSHAEDYLRWYLKPWNLPAE